MPVKIENWAVHPGDYDIYTPPECITKHLSGNVYGHPRFEDGTFVSMTTAIQSFNKRIIITKNTEYELGEPSPGYREWLRIHRPNWNPDEPFTLIFII